MKKLQTLFLVIVEVAIAVIILYYLRPLLVENSNYEISTVLPILLDISFLAVFASFGSRLAKVFNIAPVSGKIFMGVLIGPALFGVIDPNSLSIEIIRLAGMLFILFEAGLRFDLLVLKKDFTSSILIASLGTIIQLALFSLVGFYFLQLDWLPAVFLGGIFSATSIGLAVEALKAGNKLNSDVGSKILGSALVSNILGVLILTLLSNLLLQTIVGANSIIWMLISLVVFIIVAYIMWSYGFANLAAKYLDRHYSSTSTGPYTRFFFGSLILGAVIASAIGLEPILGAFGTGLVLSKVDNKIKHEVWSKIEGYMHIFVGGFLVSIGTMLTQESLLNKTTWLYALAFVVLAFIGKYAVRYFINNKNNDGQLIGLAMSIRGEVALVFLAVAIINNIFTTEIITAALLAIILVTIFSVILFERSAQKQTGVRTGEIGEAM